MRPAICRPIGSTGASCSICNTRTARWALGVKCPDHLFALYAIRAVYPDARLVFVHRDPVKVLLSVAKLTEVVRRPFTRRLDPHEIGRQESRRWLEGTGR